MKKRVNNLVSKSQLPELPLGTRVLVQIDKVEEKSEGGIVLVESTVENEKTMTQTGTLVAIGPCAFSGFGDGSPWAEVGDKVRFIRHAGQLIEVEGIEYRILNDVDMISKQVKH
jgi:co-chaperonin GroES (HSP10)